MIRILTILIFFLIPAWLVAQPTDIRNAYRIEGTSIVLYLDSSWSLSEQKNLLTQSGMKGLSLDTLWQFGNLGQWADNGWKLERTSKTVYRIYKPLTDLSGKLKWTKEVVVLNDYWEKLKQQTTATFGYNSFKRRTVTLQQNGTTQFFLEGQLNAREVFLSGTFNGWSTLSNPMTKTDSGWVAQVILQPGKHCYKFVVSGRWMHDMQNNQREDDYHEGFNSVYFVTNQEFRLSGYSSSKEVILTGSFNQWNENDLKMRKSGGIWKLPVYLAEGTYSYKFIVDKLWMTDPANPDVRDDGAGNKNSFISLGEPVKFKLAGFLNARRVFVTGNFNNWSENELAMKQTSKGWELNYTLGAGNYQYKFIVDGKWILDPAISSTGRIRNELNTVMAVKPNHKFVLKGYKGAHEVYIAGNFNDWGAYSMEKSGDTWVLDLYLTPGKTLYKILIDGKWIIDPDNDLWEQNEFGTGNSVLWIRPK